MSRHSMLWFSYYLEMFVTWFISKGVIIKALIDYVHDHPKETPLHLLFTFNISYHMLSINVVSEEHRKQFRYGRRIFFERNHIPLPKGWLLSLHIDQCQSPKDVPSIYHLLKPSSFLIKTDCRKINVLLVHQGVFKISNAWSLPNITEISFTHHCHLGIVDLTTPQARANIFL